MKAVIYARFSPRRNEDGCESNDTQIELCQAYCGRQKYPVGPIFQDKALSGDNEDRPGLWDAVDAISKGDVLVVYKLDRLARSVYLSHLIERAVLKVGGKIVSATGEGTWADTPEDELIRNILRAIAEYERKVIAARTKAAMLRHQRTGRRMSNLLPYGWQPDPDDPARMVKNGAEQGVIRKIVELAGLKFNSRQIARALEGDGHLSRNGKRFGHTTVLAILKRHAEG